MLIHIGDDIEERVHNALIGLFAFLPELECLWLLGFLRSLCFHMFSSVSEMYIKHLISIDDMGSFNSFSYTFICHCNELFPPNSWSYRTHLFIFDVSNEGIL